MSDALDIVQRILHLVSQAQPTFSEEQAIQIEQQVRHEYGGEQVTIAKRAPMLRAAREKVRAEIGIQSVEELHRQNPGVTRRTIYNWLRKPAPKEK